MNLFDRVLNRPEFRDDPPVLVDIGASGGLNPAWKRIARHSVCIAFDAEPSGLSAVPQSSGDYRRLCVFNLLVTANGSESADFYLTKSPQCSSFLLPNREQLSNWAFSGRFDVVAKQRVKTTHLANILNELGLRRIDWFKTDSQGTDLRLFTSLGESLIRNTLIAEFEPGIIDAYHEEDKLWQVMSFMESHDFWMTEMNVKGSQRWRKEPAIRFTGIERRLLPEFMKSSPGWAEVAYMNCFESADLSSRDFLLGWLFAVMKGQYGFAWQLAETGRQRFGDSVYSEMEDHSLLAMRLSCFQPSAHFRLWQRLSGKVRKWVG